MIARFTGLLCLQEHWLADAQKPELGNDNDSLVFTGVSGFDNSVIFRGRPYGGVQLCGDRILMLL